MKTVTFKVAEFALDVLKPVISKMSKFKREELPKYQELTKVSNEAAIREYLNWSFFKKLAYRPKQGDMYKLYMTDPEHFNDNCFDVVAVGKLWAIPMPGRWIRYPEVREYKKILNLTTKYEPLVTLIELNPYTQATITIEGSELYTLLRYLQDNPVALDS